MTIKYIIMNLLANDTNETRRFQKIVGFWIISESTAKRKISTQFSFIKVPFISQKIFSFLKRKSHLPHFKILIKTSTYKFSNILHKKFTNILKRKSHEKYFTQKTFSTENIFLNIRYFSQTNRT